MVWGRVLAAVMVAMLLIPAAAGQASMDTMTGADTAQVEAEGRETGQAFYQLFVRMAVDAYINAVTDEDGSVPDGFGPLISQLEAFRDGTRSGAVPTPIA